MKNEIEEVKDDLKKRIHAVEVSCYACADPIRKELALIENLEKAFDRLIDYVSKNNFSNNVCKTCKQAKKEECDFSDCKETIKNYYFFKGEIK